MISAISTFASFSILAFNVISQIEFSQKSIQIAININHSNPHQHIHPIKSHSNLLNNHLQMPQMLHQNLAKMFQKYTNMTIQPLLDSIYYMMWLLIICIMHWAYFICRKSDLLHVIMYIIQSKFVVNGYILNVIYLITQLIKQIINWYERIEIPVLRQIYNNFKYINNKIMKMSSNCNDTSYSICDYKPHSPQFKSSQLGSFHLLEDQLHSYFDGEELCKNYIGQTSTGAIIYHPIENTTVKWLCSNATNGRGCFIGYNNIQYKNAKNFRWTNGTSINVFKFPWFGNPWLDITNATNIDEYLIEKFGETNYTTEDALYANVMVNVHQMFLGILKLVSVAISLPITPNFE